MKFGERTLRMLSKGKDVEELQLRLAGFAGTVWDGDFGRKTKNQVMIFQRDFMNIASPSRIVEEHTFTALDIFANKYPIDFKALRCPPKERTDGDVCSCKGFGQQRYRKTYLKNRALLTLDWNRTGIEGVSEKDHQYEYPGIHKAVLHTYRAFLFYASETKYISPRITSGYRCHIDNVKKGRTSTNHMGKAMDFSFDIARGQNKQKVCNEARNLLVEKSNCQIRWGQKNHKSLEPGVPGVGREFTADTWIHLDVREFDEQFLQDRFFVTNSYQLDNKELVD
jgi:hypothetical protein